MVDGHPVALRERVVAAYEAGKGTYPKLAELFGVGEASVKRWVWLKRKLGDLSPKAAGGGRVPMRPRRAHRGDQPSAPEARTHPRFEHEARSRSAWVRCKKKRRRPLESQRADVAFKRTHFAMKIRRIPFERLVFLDESGLNLAMSRSHAWVRGSTG
jgi:hypothetical protein